MINWDFFRNFELLLRMENFIPSKRIDSILELEEILPDACWGIIFDIDQTLVPYRVTRTDEKFKIVADKLRLKYTCCLLTNSKPYK